MASLLIYALTQQQRFHVDISLSSQPKLPVEAATLRTLQGTSVVVDQQTFNTVDNEDFKEMSELFDKDVVVPNRHAIGNHIIRLEED